MPDAQWLMNPNRFCYLKQAESVHRRVPLFLIGLEVREPQPLLAPRRIKGGIEGVEILGVQMILGDAEGIGDFSISNYQR